MQLRGLNVQEYMAIDEQWFKQRIEKDGFDPLEISKPNLNA